MIKGNITVSYKTFDDINHIMQINVESENVPYSIAALTSQMIKDSNANFNIVIENLIEEFGYETNNNN